MGDLDGDGIVQDVVDQRSDFVGHGRGKQEDLALCGQALEDLADVRQEAHVEHAVGFVENEALDAVQIEFALAEEIQQAAGAGDGDFRALADAVDLRLLAHAAVDGDVAEARVFAQFGQHVLRLFGQFARGADDQRAQLVARAGHQAVEEGQDERGGLAGSGLGQAHHVAPRENGRNGLLLDRGRGGIALLGNVLKKPGVEAQRLEAHGGNLLVADCEKWFFVTPSAKETTPSCRSGWIRGRLAAHLARREAGQYGIRFRLSSAGFAAQRPEAENAHIRICV